MGSPNGEGESGATTFGPGQVRGPGIYWEYWGNYATYEDWKKRPPPPSPSFVFFFVKIVKNSVTSRKVKNAPILLTTTEFFIGINVLINGSVN